MTRYTWIHLISIAICIALGLIQLYYINNISKKFEIMKIRFSRKKEKKRKRRERQLKKLETYKPGINQDDEMDDEASEASQSYTESDSITDQILSTANDKDVPDWKELSFRDKGRLFNLSSLVLIISCILIIIGSIFM